MSLVNGVVIGLVTEISERGMVKVKLQGLPDEPETDWIRIATTMSGNNRGTFFMPEEKDEALVAFEHGDVEFPYIVGFLWNGKDKPPEDNINVRRIKTKSGHTIEFDDNQGKEKIHIESQGKHHIELDDKPGQENVVIRSKGGHVVRMDDGIGQKKVLIETASKHSIEINDMPGIGGITIKTNTSNSITITEMGMITISAPIGIINVDCLTANITAKTMLNITAPMIMANGVIKATAIISEAVISKAFNPGVPGNIFGL